jgi:class 3 adenylate cyclase/TolB-like protein
MPREQRRLAAIMSIDVSGYSALMGVDETGTLAALKTHRAELVDPSIAEYGGRIVKTTGDGLLVEFGSVVDAVQCAVTIQRRMAERNWTIPLDRRIVFRIGVNVGDIIIDDSDIYGDGVNIAARLESIAEPGGIFVSAMVRDQIGRRLGLPVDDLGLQSLKNIAEPVHVYRVGLESRVAPNLGARLRTMVRTRRGRTIKYGAGAFLLAAIAASAGWLLMRAPSRDVTAGSLPPAASIAVLPVRFASENASLAPLAKGLTADLIAALANAIREGHVVPTTSAYEREKPADLRAVGREMNVRYVADGEISVSAEALLVSLRVIEAGTGQQILAERKETALSKWSLDRSGIIATLTSATREAIRRADERHAASLAPATTTAAGLTAQGDALLRSRVESAQAQREGRKFYDRALQVDPTYAAAWAGRAWTFLLEYDYDFSDAFDGERLLRELDEASRRAIELDDKYWFSLRVRTQALAAQFRWSGALEANDRARALDPTRRGFLFDRAYILTMMGRPEEVLRVMEEYKKLGGTADFMSCRARLVLGPLDAAIDECERAVVSEPYYVGYLYLTAAYTLQGDTVKADSARKQLLQRAPGFTISRYRAKKYSDEPEYLKQMETMIYPALRKAGVPE